MREQSPSPKKYRTGSLKPKVLPIFLQKCVRSFGKCVTRFRTFRRKRKDLFCLIIQVRPGLIEERLGDVYIS